MASILSASGFNLESLQDFSNRFTNLSIRLDCDLQKIWVCHKNPENIPISEEINLLHSTYLVEDYYSLSNRIKKKISAGKQFYNLLTEFSAFHIFEQVYSKFKKQLTTYLFTNCYLFYNWGINAFEPVIDHYEIHSAIQKRQKQSLPLKKKNRYDFIYPEVVENVRVIESLTESNREKSVDLFEEPSDAFQQSRRKTVSFRSVVEASKKAEKFYDIQRNSKNSYQEIFSLNKVLYDIKQRALWPGQHVLSKHNVDDLVLFIIQIPLVTSNPIESKLSNEHENWVELRELLNKFIQSHMNTCKNNGYGRILKKHLKSVELPSNRKLHPIPKPTVCSYVLDILRRVLPRELFGRNNIRKTFFSGLIKVLNGNKGENFIWYSLLRSVLMNKSNLTWCSQLGDNYTQSQVMLKLFKFIVIHYVFVILRNYFYITETGSSGFGLRYYQKTDMERASSACLNTLLQNGHIRRLKRRDLERPTLERNWLNTGNIAEEDLNRKLKKTMTEGTEYKQPIAHVRFLPKSDGNDELRIITNIMEKVSRSRAKKLEKYFTARLSRRKKNLFFVKLFMEFLVDKIGSGFRPLPCNPKLEEAWKKAVVLKEKHGKLYFVKADISDAFDSVRYNVLREVLTKAFERDTELGNVQLKKIIEWKKLSGRIQKAARFSFSNRPRENSVMINRSVFLHHDKEIRQYLDLKFLQIIEQVVMEQKVEIKGKVFKLVKGLAQGSAGKFSPQLCEIYYSSLDNLFFKELLQSSDSIFLRGVDDYLFVTPDVEKARRFLELVTQGFPEYNVRFNGHKLKSNLIENVQEISYLGLIFNFETMSVKPNYSKYHQRDYLSNMNLLDKRGNNHFKKQLFLHNRLLRVKCLKLHSIVVNGSYNDLKTMRRIVFEASLMQTLRVLTLADYLYSGSLKNDAVVFETLLISSAKIRGLVAGSAVTADEVNWLFFFAALNISRKFSGQFKLLLLMVRYRLQKCEREFFRKEADLLFNFLKDDILEVEYWRTLNGIFKVGKLPLKA